MYAEIRIALPFLSKLLTVFMEAEFLPPSLSLQSTQGGKPHIQRSQAAVGQALCCALHLLYPVTEQLCDLVQ